tara:strand:- start:2047 stop:2463 length:417 start_codon:yes stop_codon:yes gene_type:complete
MNKLKLTLIALLISSPTFAEDVVVTYTDNSIVAVNNAIHQSEFRYTATIKVPLKVLESWKDSLKGKYHTPLRTRYVLDQEYTLNLNNYAVMCGETECQLSVPLIMHQKLFPESMVYVDLLAPDGSTLYLSPTTPKWSI